MRNIIITILLSLFTIAVNAQSNFYFYGYVKDLGMYYKPVDSIPLSEDKSVDKLMLNQIHNRLNFRWYAGSAFTLGVEARNRIYFGQMVREYPDYEDVIDKDKGYFDLSTILFSSDGCFMHSILDRAWLEYSGGKFQARIGRQRINWGLNLVWNPNDIFNSFSYFDFDYEERPGTDAVKIQYYTNETASAELVWKTGRNKDETAIAGMYRFSEFNYDFQFLGGWVGKDYVLGGGWTGDIKGGGFRGELSWFMPREENNGSLETFVASVSGDYTLKNSLYLHGGVLFNSQGAKGEAGGRSVFDQNLSAKMLSMAMYNLFGQFSYPITPIVSGNFSAMLNPMDGSSYLGPSLTMTVGNNMELMVNSQLFFGDDNTEYGDYGKFIFGRIKWAF